LRGELRAMLTKSDTGKKDHRAMLDDPFVV